MICQWCVYNLFLLPPNDDDDEVLANVYWYGSIVAVVTVVIVQFNSQLSSSPSSGSIEKSRSNSSYNSFTISNSSNSLLASFNPGSVQPMCGTSSKVSNLYMYLTPIGIETRH